MKRTNRGKWGPLGAVAGVATMALTMTTLGGTPAVSALPAGDCAVPFPVADLVAGDDVTGLTVSSGTTPDGFTGEVLGVLKNGIAPGLDMVMMRLTSPEIDRVGGIWSGMSGSPVYAEDGRLIGAVSYGLSLGPSPVAGVTPFEEMDDYVTAPTVRVKVSDRIAGKIAAASDVTRAQAAGGFAALPLSSGISGVPADRLGKTRGRAYLDKKLHAVGGTAPTAAGPETIVAGGNLAMTTAYGDITIGGVGTATSVCNDQVVGFGHYANFQGKQPAAMHPADAIYVQEDSTLGPYKVANISDPAGTIIGDHLAGITGVLGALPETVGVTSSVTYGARSRTGSTQVSTRDWSAATTFYQNLANHERVLDGYGPGSEDFAWTIQGRRASGEPFTVDLSNRYVSAYDITWSAAWDAPDSVWVLQQYPGVKIDDVSMTSTVTDATDEWSVSKIQYKNRGSWTTVQPRGRVEAKAGKALRMRAVLTDEAGATRRVPVTTDIPAKLAGQSGRLYVMGGSEVWSNYYGARTLDQFLKRAATAVRNDQVVAQLSVYSGRSRVSKKAASAAQDRVVNGSKTFRLVVR